MNLALFDFDGTITNRDTYSGFVRFAVHGTRKVLGSLAVSPVILGYRFGLLRAHQARPLVSRVSFQGRAADEVRRIGRRYALEVLPGVVRSQA